MSASFRCPHGPCPFSGTYDEVKAHIIRTEPPLRAQRLTRRILAGVQEGDQR